MKKHIKAILFLGFVVAIGECCGFRIVSSISDVFQGTLCTDKFCIDKPKGWIPMYVDRNGKRYILNIINKDYLWLKKTKNSSQYKHDLIVMQKNKAMIMVEEYNKTIHESKHYKQSYLYNKKCYRSQKLKSVIIVCPTEKIVLSALKNNEDVLHEILNIRALNGKRGEQGKGSGDNDNSSLWLPRCTW